MIIYVFVSVCVLYLCKCDTITQNSLRKGFFLIHIFLLEVQAKVLLAAAVAAVGVDFDITMIFTAVSLLVTFFVFAVAAIVSTFIIIVVCWN